MSVDVHSAPGVRDKVRLSLREQNMEQDRDYDHAIRPRTENKNKTAR